MWLKKENNQKFNDHDVDFLKILLMKYSTPSPPPRVGPDKNINMNINKYFFINDFIYKKDNMFI